MADYMHEASGTVGSFAWKFTMKSTSTASEAAAETAWTTAIQAMFNTTSFNSLLGSNVALTETSTSTASADWHQTTKTLTTVSIAGAAADSLPYQIAAVVTLRSNLATKYGHGRWFLPPLAPAALDTAGLIWSAAATSAIVAAVNAAISAWGTTITPVILHRRAPLSGAVAAYSTTPITSGDVSNKPVIQKRRGDKFTVTRSALTF